MNNKKRVLSLLSGCGGMDIGFEGGFKCLKRSIKQKVIMIIVEDVMTWY